MIDAIDFFLSATVQRSAGPTEPRKHSNILSITFYSFVIIATDRAIVKQLTAIYRQEYFYR